MKTGRKAEVRFRRVSDYGVQLKRGDELFLAVYKPAHPSGIVVEWHEQWVLSRLVYQRNARLGPVKRPRAKQRPRLRRLGIFRLLRDCRDFIAERRDR